MNIQLVDAVISETDTAWNAKLDILDTQIDSKLWNKTCFHLADFSPTKWWGNDVWVFLSEGLCLQQWWESRPTWHPWKTVWLGKIQKEAP